jgi:STIP1 homology and U-box containing protein 1
VLWSLLRSLTDLPKEIPGYLIDDISFEVMHDPVTTKHGHSYERATIVEHLKRNPVDPLTREPLSLADLRPNLALRQACNEFWESNSGWAYDW